MCTKLRHYKNIVLNWNKLNYKKWDNSSKYQHSLAFDLFYFSCKKA